MIPFLAYVQIAGMNPLEEIDPNDKGSYANASLSAASSPSSAGPLANYLFASVLFFVSFFFGGRAVRSPTDVEASSRAAPPRPPASRTATRSSRSTASPVAEWEQMADIISKHPGEPIPVVVERGGRARHAPRSRPRTRTARARSACSARPRSKRARRRRRRPAVARAQERRRGREEPRRRPRPARHGKVEGELGGPAGMVKETAKRREERLDRSARVPRRALGVPRRVQPDPVPRARRRPADVPRLRGDDPPPPERAHRGAHPRDRPRHDARLMVYVTVANDFRLRRRSSAAPRLARTAERASVVLAASPCTGRPGRGAASRGGRGPITFAQRGAERARSPSSRAARTDRGRDLASSRRRDPASIWSSTSSRRSAGSAFATASRLRPTTPSCRSSTAGRARSREALARSAPARRAPSLVVAREATLAPRVRRLPVRPRAGACALARRGRVPRRRSGRERASWAGDSRRLRRADRARRAPSAGPTSTRALRAAGRARGVDLESVLVFDERGAIAGCRPPAPAEPARHKLLDLIGDLALYGGPPRGAVEARRARATRATHAIVAEALARGVLARVGSGAREAARVACSRAALALLRARRRVRGRIADEQPARARRARAADAARARPPASSPTPSSTPPRASSPTQRATGAGRAYAWFAHSEVELPLDAAQVVRRRGARRRRRRACPGVGRDIFFGNPEIWARGLWSSSTGSRRAAGFGLVLPVPRELVGRSRTRSSRRCASCAPGTRRTSTISRSPSARGSTSATSSGRFIFQFRQGLDIAVARARSRAPASARTDYTRARDVLRRLPRARRPSASASRSGRSTSSPPTCPTTSAPRSPSRRASASCSAASRRRSACSCRSPPRCAARPRRTSPRAST